LTDTYSDLWKDFTALAADPSKLPTVGVSALIQLLQGLIKTALQATDWLVTLLVAVLKALISGLEAILNTSLTDLTFVSWLYTNVIAKGQQEVNPPEEVNPPAGLTMLRATALLAAVPLTLLYKLTHSGAAPFADPTQWKAILAQEFSATSSPTAATLPADLLTTVFAVQTVSNSFYDLSSESEDVPAVMLSALFNAALALTAQVLTWPNGEPLTIISFDGMSDADKTLAGLWIANWVPPALSLYWLAASTLNLEVNPSLGTAERVEDVGILIVSVLGRIRQGLAVVGSVWKITEDPTDLTLIPSGIQNVIAQTADTYELLRLSEVKDATEDISTGFKLILNPICNMAVAGIQAVETAV
jgi:hypothetical protein